MDLGKFALASALAVLLQAGAAHAADLLVRPAPIIAAPAPVLTWGGSYLGLHAGYLWSSTRVEDNGIVVEENAPTNGFVGGLLGGHNWQSGDWVYGLEGDFGWSNAHGTGPAEAEPNSYDLDWNAHIRGRVGIAPGNGPLLLFLAGGAAFAHFTFTNGETSDKSASTYVGGSIGAGADYQFSRNLIGRAEFLYDIYSMGSGLITDGDYTAHLENTATARAALIFRFN